MAPWRVSGERGADGRGESRVKSRESRVCLAESVEYGRGRKCDDDDGDSRCWGDSAGIGDWKLEIGEWLLSSCVRSTDSAYSRTLFCAKVVETMGNGVASIGDGKCGAESGTVGMLVCATGADTLFYRRTRRPRDPRRTREERSILLAGDDYAECADSGSGRTRCLGNGSVRNDERSVGRRAVMGDKYATSVPYLAFFTQK